MVTKAVASSVKTPGVFVLVDLLGAPQNPGLSAERALIISPRSAAGDLTVDTEVRKVFGPEEAATAFGVNTPGHLAAIVLFAQYGDASVDCLAPTASAGASATETQTLTGTATENSTIRFTIHGRTVDVPWNSGETDAQFRARSVPRLNAESNRLAVTYAAGVGAGEHDLTARVAGPWGNDILLSVEVLEGGAGITIAANPANAAGGTTEPNFTTALTAVEVTEYRRIVPCLSNADATDATSSSNADRLRTHINAFEAGLDALLQIATIGHTGSIANVEAGAIGRNDEAMQYIYGLNFQSLPSELAGAEAGDALRGIVLIAPNYNRIGNSYTGLFGPADTVADKLTPTEREDLLNNGVSPIDINTATNQLRLVRPITTHSQDSGNPDFRAFDLTGTDGMYSVAADLRVFLQQEFPNASISPDVPDGGDPLPERVVEVRDVKEAVTSRLRVWVRLGVVNRVALEAAIANDELFFGIDDGDDTQVNIFLPLAIIKPLAKFGLVASKVA